MEFNKNKLIDTTETIDYENLMLRYLVGNIVVVGKKNFTDSDIIASDNFYTKSSASAVSKYFNKQTEVYYIAGFSSDDDLIKVSYDEKYDLEIKQTRKATFILNDKTTAF